MGVKAGLWAIADLLVTLMVGAVMIWVNCLPLSSTFAASMQQDDFILVSVLNIGSAATMMLCCFMPNLTVLYRLGDLRSTSIIISFLVLLLQLASPTVLVAFYVHQGRDLRSLGSTLFAPLVCWLFLMYLMAAWQAFVIFMNLFYRSRTDERHHTKDQ